MTYMTRLAPVIVAGALLGACLPARLTPSDIRQRYDACIGVADVSALGKEITNPALARTTAFNRATNDYLAQCVPAAQHSREENVPLTGQIVQLHYVADGVNGLEMELRDGFAVARQGTTPLEITYVLAPGQEEVLAKIEEARRKEEAKPEESKGLIRNAKDFYNFWDKHNPFKSDP